MALGVAAAALGSAPFAAVLKSGTGPVGWTHAGLLAAAALPGWALYAATWPTACRILVARREAILQAVTRD